MDKNDKSNIEYLNETEQIYLTKMAFINVKIKRYQIGKFRMIIIN